MTFVYTRLHATKAKFRFSFDAKVFIVSFLILAVSIYVAKYSWSADAETGTNDNTIPLNGLVPKSLSDLHGADATGL
jgi:hypothetical protein